MLQREIGLTGKNPQQPAPIPTESKTRVESEATVDQPDGDFDVLAIPGEHEGRDGEDVGVVRSASECSPNEIDTCAPVRLTVVGPAVRPIGSVAAESTPAGAATAAAHAPFSGR